MHRAENLAAFMCRLSENPEELQYAGSYLGLYRASFAFLKNYYNYDLRKSALLTSVGPGAQVYYLSSLLGSTEIQHN